MKLINKNGRWIHQDKAWNIPAEGHDGNIEDQDSGEVLGLLNDATHLGNLVVLETKDMALRDEQTWIRKVADANNWFRLKNPCSGRVLTAQTSNHLTIGGMYMSELFVRL